MNIATTIISVDGKKIQVCLDCGRIVVEGSDHTKCEEVMNQWRESKCSVCGEKNKDCVCLEDFNEDY